MAPLPDAPGFRSGWISGPEGRGTGDILWGCVTSILLCSWSVLCLNIPGERNRTRYSFSFYKLRWMLFTIFFPEMLTGLAAEQWRTARQSVEDFRRLLEKFTTDTADHPVIPQEGEVKIGDSGGSPAAATDVTTVQISEIQPTPLDERNIINRKNSAAEEKNLTTNDLPRISTTLSATPDTNLMLMAQNPWSLRHGFFADMGGIRIKFPDWPVFPVNGHQILRLVELGYIGYPAISEPTIWDKNKADSFARWLTLLEVSWFSLQCFARFAEHLTLTTMELTTLSFIFCTTQTYFFWYHKPLDVEEPVVINCDIPLHRIMQIEDAKGAIPHHKRFKKTPLDFLEPPTANTSLTAPFMFGANAAVFRLPYIQRPETWPIETFGNTQITPPRGLTLGDLIYASVFVTLYFCIHLCAWHWSFPTETERKLWIAATFVLLGVSTFYFVAWAIGTYGGARWYARVVLGQEGITSIVEIMDFMTPTLGFIQHFPVVALYSIARLYIIVEGFVALRKLPEEAFGTVQWSLFIPHFD